MEKILLVGIGGFFGSILRYLSVEIIGRLMGGKMMWIATFSVNAVGCLVIGFLGGLAMTTSYISPSIRLFILVGLLGGFTTYSTFGYEAQSLVRERELITAALYIGAHLVVGIGFAWFGFALAPSAR
jgi:CrcB protein